ncbi:hypothetical protein RHSIM_Rhsim07G0104700 [Rhododendron simsii]|uniref:Histidine kinase domain-containing protein n=1 Tax=Rhododendron simsii TaxID=118357 RepID=A0A834GMB1_RHOSS|nr:hypothetical protein RHSIM_Rhsim07G0104700 [Rhododendron simsii]
MHSKTVAVVMTPTKLATAVVSCATALMLVHIIPDLLSVKTLELFLKNKAEELDREMGLIMSQEETGRHVRMLTHEIRSTLDRHTILKTTLVELGRTLDLEECALWMPSRTGLTLQLSHALSNIIPVGSSVPINIPIVNEVFNSAEAIQLTPDQRVMIETILKSSNLLATLINDVLDLSRLEDGSLKLDAGVFNLHEVFRQAINLIKPIASVKKLSLTIILALDLHVYAMGDEKRVIQTIINIVGNAVKFAKKGYVSVVALIAKPESLRDVWRAPEFYPVSSDGYFFLRVQIEFSLLFHWLNFKCLFKGGYGNVNWSFLKCNHL